MMLPKKATADSLLTVAKGFPLRASRSRKMDAKSRIKKNGRVVDRASRCPSWNSTVVGMRLDVETVRMMVLLREGRRNRRLNLR